MSKRKHVAEDVNVQIEPSSKRSRSNETAEEKAARKQRKADKKVLKLSAASTPDISTPTADSPAEPPAKYLEEDKASKKARKEAKKAAKLSKNVPLSSSEPLKIDSAEITKFLSDNSITYEPAESTRNYPPVLVFSQLPIDENLRKGVASFEKPTPVQGATWPILLAGKDCIGIAETGSGKTLAFGIPAVRYLQSQPAFKKSKKSKKSSVSVLVVAPTRELAMQTYDTLAALCAPLDYGCTCIYGGVPKPPQIQALQNGARVVVGTPGRLIDLAEEGNLDLSQVGFLVLDEADRMLDKGFEQDIRKIISQTRKSGLESVDSEEGRQTAMFSATWPLSVRQLANDFMSAPVRITVGSDELTASTSVHQSVIVLDDNRAKESLLLKTLRSNGMTPGKRSASGDKVIAFALYKKEASRIEGNLRRNGFNVSCLQGDMTQVARTKALDDFKQGITTVLVATDVAARGLDLPKVELVINVTFPLTIEDYIHRIGRTGRAGRKGKAITFFTEADKAHAGELQRVLREANMDIPEDLKAFGGTVKKKSHPIYGDHYNEELAGKTATKIVFD